MIAVNNTVIAAREWG